MRQAKGGEGGDKEQTAEMNHIWIDKWRGGTGVGPRPHDREEGDELFQRESEGGDVILEDLGISCARAEEGIQLSRWPSE
jgi:hypothetical protein